MVSAEATGKLSHPDFCQCVLCQKNEAQAKVAKGSEKDDRKYGESSGDLW